MGTNRRYPSRVAAGIDRAIDHVMARPQPLSLSDEELDKEHSSVTAAKVPIPVKAWVRYPETAVRASGRALAWTNRAVFVEWDTPGGGVARAWVWASAVERQRPPTQPPGR